MSLHSQRQMWLLPLWCVLSDNYQDQPWARDPPGLSVRLFVAGWWTQAVPSWKLSSSSTRRFIVTEIETYSWKGFFFFLPIDIFFFLKKNSLETDILLTSLMLCTLLHCLWPWHLFYSKWVVKKTSYPWNPLPLLFSPPSWDNFFKHYFEIDLRKIGSETSWANSLGNWDSVAQDLIYTLNPNSIYSAVSHRWCSPVWKLGDGDSIGFICYCSE